jgi:hypothetical protein
MATSLPEHVIIDRIEDKVVTKEVNTTDLDQVDPVQLSVYGHRLMGIAEQVRFRPWTVADPCRWETSCVRSPSR